MTTHFKLHRVFLFLVAYTCISLSLLAQVWTKVNPNGSTALRIKDDKGVRSWSAFDHVNTANKVDGENPVPGDCPTDYTKDPTASLVGGKKYWILYRDCDGEPGTKHEYEVTFFNDASRIDKWYEWSPKPIPDPPNKMWLYWGIPALFILVVVFLYMRRKRSQ